MKKLDRYEFIWKAVQKHGYKYDYKKVVYINSQTKVCIICPEHGEYNITPNHHLQGEKCAKCYGRYKTNEYIINEFNVIHDNKYNYSNINYVNNRKKICITCPEHGEFWQIPHEHLDGKGCPKCGGTLRLNKNEFIENAKLVHNNKYDYSKVNYINNKTKVCIICPEHGEFWQIPNNHIKKYNSAGCPKCNTSLLEKYLMYELNKNNIEYIYQYYNKKIIGRQSLDFYIPEYHIAIECQGVQHYIPVDFFDGEKGLKDTIKRDSVKYNKCIENGMKIYYFTHYDGEINNPIYNQNNLFFNVNELIKAIH